MDSIRATAGDVVSLLRRPRFLTWAAAILSVAGILWMRAVDTALWMETLAKAEHVREIEKRVDTIERERLDEKRAAYAEQVATVSTLRTMAAEAAARARPKDANAAENARARFDELILKKNAPLTALDIVLREVRR